MNTFSESPLKTASNHTEIEKKNFRSKIHSRGVQVQIFRKESCRGPQVSF